MFLLRAVTVLIFLVTPTTSSVIYSEKYALYLGKLAKRKDALEARMIFLNTYVFLLAYVSLVFKKVPVILITDRMLSCCCSPFK